MPGDINPYNADPVDPNAPRVVDLGNGYSIVYGGGAPQVVKNVDNSVAGGSTAGYGTIEAERIRAAQAAQQSQGTLAEQARQFDQTNAYNHAVNDQQYALKQGDLLGNIGGQQTENGRQFDQSQALNYYKYLSDLASNPRNFVQTFFASRGQIAPTNSSAYGNVNALQQFHAPQLNIQGQPAGGVAPTANTTTSATAAPAYNPTARVQQALGPGVSWASGNLGAQNQDGSYQTTAPPTTLGGNAPLQPGQTEDPTFQAFRQNVAQNALGGNVSQEQAMHPKDVSPNGLAIYKKGGVIPEPVVGVGVHSGNKYMFGENGPEGVVPAHMLPQFLQRMHGQQVGPQHQYARGGIIGSDYNSPSPDPLAPPTPPTENPYGSGYGGYDYSAGLPTVSPSYPDTSPGSGYGGYDYSAPQPTGSPSYPDTSPGQGYGGYDYSASAPAPTNTGPNPIDAANALNQQNQTPQRISTASAPQPFVAPVQQQTPITPVAGTGSATNQFGAGGLIGAGGATGGAGSSVTTPPIQQPLSTPQASNNFNASGTPTPGLTPAQVSPAGTFGSPSGNLPSFLPGEDNGGSVLQSLLSAGALPPFLSRLFAQNNGVQSQGTNQPQRMDLPKDVPLVSKLAFNQMTPDEQQALLSYVSAYGVTPETYKALIEQYAPQGSPGQAPTFGSRFAYARQ